MKTTKMMIAILLGYMVTMIGGQAAFVAVGDSIIASNSYAIAYSNDGMTWFSTSPNTFTTRGYGISYSNTLGLWTALGAGTNSIAYSTNGTTWIGLGTGVYSVAGKCAYWNEFQGLWISGGQGGNTMAFSTTGTIWTGMGPAIFTTITNDITYSLSLNRWVAVGSGTHTIAWSANGVSWTGLGMIMFSAQGNSVSFANGLFVATGSTATNTQAWSADGQTWTGGGLLFPTTANDADFGQGRWISIGVPSGNSFIVNSTDGKAWNTRGVGTGELGVGNGLIYDSGLNIWIAVGSNGGTTAYSTNGNNWNLGTSVFSTAGYAVASSNSSVSGTTVSPTTTIAPTTTAVPTTTAIPTTIANTTTAPPNTTIVTTTQTPTTTPIPTTQTPTTTPVILITSDITNLIVNQSASIDIGYSISVNGNLTVIGDLYVAGSWTLFSSLSSANITGNLILQGSTVFFVNSSLGIIQSSVPVTTEILTIQGTPTITLTLDAPLPIGTTRTYVMARFATRSGVITSTNLQSLAGQQGCPSASTSYSSTSLSVTVSVGTCPQNNVQLPSGLSIGAIVGIAIGVVSVAILAMTILMILVVRHRNKMTKEAKDSIIEADAQAIRDSSRILKASATLNCDSPV